MFELRMEILWNVFERNACHAETILQPEWLSKLLLLRTTNGPLKPFARLGRESLRGGLAQLVRVLMDSLMQKTNLLPVTAAPLAKQQVEAQPESLRQ